jgi:DNA-binding HxlR family transcriptional regulator
MTDVERKSFATMHCSIAQTLEVIGEWWTMLIVRDVFLGVTRFDQLQERLGISRNVLNQRLAHLIEHGVLEKVAYSERPLRHDYQLTDKGRDLFPVLTAMRQWGDTYAAPDGAPLRLRHKACGRYTQAQLRCDKCGEPLDSSNVRAAAGPGDLDRIVASTR